MTYEALCSVFQQDYGVLCMLTESVRVNVLYSAQKRVPFPYVKGNIALLFESSNYPVFQSKPS
jgi:hypothetical protein